MTTFTPTARNDPGPRNYDLEHNVNMVLPGGAHTVATGSLPGYLLLADLTTNGPVVTVPALREADRAEVTVHVVTGELSRQARRRVREEAVALADVRSRYLVPLVEHGETPDGRCFLVTERYGPSLADELMAHRSLPVDECRPAVSAAVRGLELLHSNDIVHRGVSPAALVRGMSGFVLACPMPSDVAELLFAAGETGHEPPEVRRGLDWTPAGDVYALASTLWCLLDGKPPVRQGENWGAGDFDAPSQIPDTIPAQLAEPMRRALAGAPGDRPQSGSAFARSLAGETEPDQHFVLGTYRPMRSLGSGGSGEVIQARAADGSVVAVKLLRDELVADADWRHRLFREWSVLCGLDHPHVIKVFDLIYERNRAAGIVMELVEGTDLRRLRAGEGLTRGEALRLLSETAAGLVAVHRAGLVHRDLKPANILVRESAGRRTAVLTDFGLAKPWDQHTITQVGQVAGTPAYLAPEIARGGRPSTAGDVYSLGVTIHEVLLGGRPGEHVVANDPDDPLWTLIRGCLATEPGARPAASAVADALADLASGGRGDVVLPAPEIARDSGTSPVTTDRVAPPPWHEVVLPPGDLDEVPPTETGSRPLAEAPVSVPERSSRRRLWIVAAALTMVVGTAAGVWWGMWGRDDPKSPGPTTPAFSVYRLPTTLVVDQQGAATVSWPDDADRLPGLAQYVVMRGGRPLTEIPVGDNNKFQDLEPDADGCYYVIALGVTAAPPDPAPRPACRPN